MFYKLDKNQHTLITIHVDMRKKNKMIIVSILSEICILTFIKVFQHLFLKIYRRCRDTFIKIEWLFTIY